MAKYLITGRDKTNSKFRYEDYPTGNNSKIVKELLITVLMRRGDSFFTMSPDGSLTDVTISNSHLRSVKNGTEKDNLDNLPII